MIWLYRWLTSLPQGWDAAQNVWDCWDNANYSSLLRPWFCAACGWVPGDPANPGYATVCPTCRSPRWRVGRIAMNDGRRDVPPASVRIIGEAGQVTLVERETRR